MLSISLSFRWLICSASSSNLLLIPSSVVFNFNYCVLQLWLVLLNILSLFIEGLIEFSFFFLFCFVLFFFLFLFLYLLFYYFLFCYFFLNSFYKMPPFKRGTSIYRCSSGQPGSKSYQAHSLHRRHHIHGSVLQN